MTIYVRNEEGKLTSLDVVTIKGEKGEDGTNGQDGITPNVQIGNVTTLEPGEQATVTKSGTNENPVFNFGIPRGADGTGGNGVSIDDNTVSTDKTWSSAKIEDYVLTNDNTVWLDKSGENLSIEHTKEGYLREVEILGNTIQNQDDLSDIKHLGELYVDDDGKPKLDSQGRKQYKVDVSVSNTILTDWEDYELLPGRFWNGILDSGWVQNVIKKQYGFSFEKTGSAIRGVVIKNIKGAGKGTYTVEFEMTKKKGNFDNKAYANINTFKNKEFVEQANLNQVISIKENRGYLEFNLTKEFDYLWLSIGAYGDGADVYTVNNVNLYKGSYKNINRQPTSFKTTILTPCQLMKVGDISDRLYWDNSKGRYVVEKKVEYVLPATLNIDKFETREISNKIIIYYAIPYSYNDNNHFTNKRVQYLNYMLNDWANNDILGGVSTSWEGHIYLTPAIKYSTQEEAQSWLNTLSDIKIGFIRTNARLIDTDITEELKLPTYINNTYISVTGGIDGGIKAKAPVDGGKVITALQRENIELKSTNEVQDELINVIMLATDEMLTVLEPLLPEAVDLNERSTSNIMDMYVAMVQRGIKTIDEIPARYREQVKQTLEQLEK